MYCINCGLKLGGKFCAGCGTQAALPGNARDLLPLGDWQHEVRYAVLLRFPEVRARLAEVPEAAKSLSAEEWMELGEKVFKPLGGVSVKTVTSIVVPLYAKLGIKTGKTQSEVRADPPGQVIVDVLCALARHGMPLDKVHQGDAGCVFEAKLPSDFWSFEGKVVISIERIGAKTKVEAATVIPGQLYDWGKSARCLESLFGDLRSNAA
jgi:hypothetical protein